jgi:hypothetical protein
LDLIEEGYYDIRRRDKPAGGLWTSPVFCEDPWYSWCEIEMPAWVEDDCVVFLRIEGTFLSLNTGRAFPKWFLDYDCLIYKHNDRYVDYFSKHGDYWAWDCDTVWIKNRSCIKEGMIVPKQYYLQLLEANRLAISRGGILNPLEANLRNVLSELSPNTL